MAQGTRDRPEGLSFRGFPRVLWRWKWVVLGVAALASLGAYGLALRETPMYRATVVMIYQPPMAPAPGNRLFITPASQPSPQPAPPPALYSSAAGIVSNPAVVARAERILGGPPRLPYQLSTELVGGANGTYGAQLNLSVMSPSAAESVDVANAYGRAIVELSRDQQRAQIANAQKALRARLKAFSSPQSRRSPDYFALKERLQDLEKLAQAATGDYAIVVPANAPAGPYAPRPKTAAAVGLLGGLVGGIALALVLEMFSTRPRGRRAVSDSSGTLEA